MEPLRLINANMKSVKPTYVEASRDVGSNSNYGNLRSG